MAKNDVEVRISGDSKDLDKALKDGSSSLEKFKEVASAATKIAAVGFAAAAAAVFKGIEAYKEQERATNQLNQTLAQQGIFTRELSKEYATQATELQKLTTFGDEAIIAAQSRIQAYIGEEKVSKELTKATLDFAAAQGVDLKTAADLVGKSIGSSTNALTRYGVEIDSSASKQEKLQAVVAGLSQKFGGQAEAAAQGLGSLEQLNNAIGDIFEVVGQQAAPIIALFTKELFGLVDATNQSSSFASTLQSAFETVAAGAATVLNIFESLGGTVGSVLATIVESANALLAGQFQKALDIAKEGTSNVEQVLAESNDRFNDRLTAIYAAREQAEAAQYAKEEALLQQSELNKATIRDEAFQAEQEKYLEDQVVKQDAMLMENEIQMANEEQKVQIRLNALNKQLANEKDFAKKKELILQRQDLVERKIALDKEKFDRDQDQKKLDAMSETFGNLSSLMRTKNKQLFEIGKAAAIANAIVNVAQGVTRALSQYPPPFSFAAAAAQAVAGAVQISTIQSQSLAKGGPVFGGIPGKDSVPAMLMPGELVVPKQNFEETVNAVANQRAAQSSGSAVVGGSSGTMEVIIGFTEDAFQIIEQKLVERRSIGVGII